MGSSTKKAKPRRATAPSAKPGRSRPAAKPSSASAKRPPPPAKAAPKSVSRAAPKAAAAPSPPVPEAPARGDSRRHVLSLAFLRDGDEFLARLETDGGEITELKNRALDQLLMLVAGELEDLL